MPKIQMNLSIDSDLKAQFFAECKRYNYPASNAIEDLMKIWIRYSKNGENGHNKE